MARQQYDIEVPAFSGPLDLLLNLIEQNELDITALSLSTITNQYLAQVEALKEGKVPQMIDFIVIGARLMVIKSRALLPTPTVVLEGEEPEEDPAEALVRQLRLYKKFKEMASHLQKRSDAGLRTYLRLAPPPKIERKLDLTGTDVDDLFDMMVRVLIRVSQREESVAVAAPRVITIEGQLKKLRRSIRKFAKMGFRDLLSEDGVSSAELSVTLLAVLESIKRHEVVIEQPELFGPVQILLAPKDEPEPLVEAVE